MTGTLEERFRAKFTVSDGGCWLWTAASYMGYGKLAVENGQWDRAHRIAYRLYVGSIPDGCEIHHICETRLCVNPDHLRAVTRREHRQITRLGGVAKVNALKTHCVHGHELNGDNMWMHRGVRHCKECRRTEARERWRRKHGQGIKYRR